jgi:hypothetical protein
MTKTKKKTTNNFTETYIGPKTTYFDTIQFKKIKLLAQEIKKLDPLEFKSFMQNFGDSSMTELYLKIQNYYSVKIK